MPPKKSHAGMKRVYVMRQDGTGFWSWLKGAANTVNDGLKSTKLISSVAGLPFFGARGQVVSAAARQLGYGKKKKRKTTTKIGKL